MKQYIVNLTNNLIGKNVYDAIFYRINNLEKFVEHVKTDLEAGDVRAMSPTKLGEIMCSFETGDVMASKKELFNGVHFSGDCEELLRELVSLCLAYAIRDRLSEEHLPGIPKWEGRIPGFQAGAKKVIDDLVARRNQR
jgi:hypothetical protein